MESTLGVCTSAAPADSSGSAQELDARATRFLHSGSPRQGRTQAGPRGPARNLAATGHAGSDWLAAHAGTDGRLSGGFLAGSLRESSRSAVGRAGLRRTAGDRVA